MDDTVTSYPMTLDLQSFTTGRKRRETRVGGLTAEGEACHFTGLPGDDVRVIIPPKPKTAKS